MVLRGFSLEGLMLAYCGVPEALGVPGAREQGNAMPKENPFTRFASKLSEDRSAMLREAVAERGLRGEVGAGTLAEAAALHRPDLGCPKCGGPAPHGDGMGPSGSQRIAVAVDGRKAPFAAVCGHGKPSSKGSKDALLGHIAEDPHAVHGKEKAHGSPVKAAKCTDEARKADVGDPVCLECMQLVNGFCSWIKRHLQRFAGISPADPQSCLNRYVHLFGVGQGREKRPETERAVRHLLMADARFRSSRA